MLQSQAKVLDLIIIQTDNKIEGVLGTNQTGFVLLEPHTSVLRLLIPFSSRLLSHLIMSCVTLLPLSPELPSLCCFLFYLQSWSHFLENKWFLLVAMYTYFFKATGKSIYIFKILIFLTLGESYFVFSYLSKFKSILFNFLHQLGTPEMRELQAYMIKVALMIQQSMMERSQFLPDTFIKISSNFLNSSDFNVTLICFLISNKEFYF